MFDNEVVRIILVRFVYGMKMPKTWFWKRKNHEARCQTGTGILDCMKKDRFPYLDSFWLSGFLETAKASWTFVTSVENSLLNSS